MSHYEERLAQDLDRIHASIADLAKLVERALDDAMHALLDGDTQLANETVLRDNRINRASREIDRLSHAFIARHLPGAGHLRLISSVIRLNVALERVGDYAVTISRESLQLSRPPGDRFARELDRVGDESRQLLRQAVEAFNEGNADAAAATIPVVDRLENMMDDIYAELTGGTEPRSPREIVAAFVVFSLLKRIADQAKNICEQTLFAVAGQRKKTKRFRVLFVDGGNNERSLIAQGIARKSHSDAATCLSAAVDPAPEPDPAVISFLDSCGIDARLMKVAKLRPGQHELQQMDIVISLDGPVSGYVDEVPFHTSAIEWDVDAALADVDGADDDARRGAIYRFLKENIDDLIELISGSGQHD